MKLSALLLSSLLTLGVAATAQNNLPKESINIKDTTLVKKNKVKTPKTKTCKNDSTKVAEPKQTKKYPAHYCPACGRG